MSETVDGTVDLAGFAGGGGPPVALKLSVVAGPDEGLEAPLVGTCEVAQAGRNIGTVYNAKAKGFQFAAALLEQVLLDIARRRNDADRIARFQRRGFDPIVH